MRQDRENQAFYAGFRDLASTQDAGDKGWRGGAPESLGGEENRSSQHLLICVRPFHTWETKLTGK